MFSSTSRSLATLFLLPAILAIPFDGPLPTPVSDLISVSTTGWTPKPTDQAWSLPELFRRQAANKAVCGYLEGDAKFPISCPTGSCTYDVKASWFGCCSGTGTAACQPITTCVASSAISSCLDNASCFNDAGALACSASSAPFCMSMLSKAPEGGTLRHWVCAATSTGVNVLASATSGSGSALGTGMGTTSVRALSQTGSVLASVVKVTSGGAASAASALASATAAVSSAKTGGAGPRATAGAMMVGAAGVVAMLL